MTSTGFLTPGLSALLIRELGIHLGCARGDIVGMGCNTGLNALTWTPLGPSRTRPGCAVPVSSAGWCTWAARK